MEQKKVPKAVSKSQNQSSGNAVVGRLCANETVKTAGVMKIIPVTFELYKLICVLNLLNFINKV